MAVAKLLCKKRGKGGDLDWIAEVLEVSPRTIQNWVAEYKRGGNAKVGRPSYTIEQRRYAMWKVAREIKKQGYAGWRPIDAALDDVPTRLVQFYVRIFKAREKKRVLARKIENQKSVTVLLKNAYWTEDGTHLGRMNDKGIESQVMKDRGSLKTIGIKTGTAAKAEDVIALFESVKKVRGLPFVIGTDNGSAYCNELVREYLKNEKVIHLLSLPRTPEHNGSAENGIKELKIEAALGKGMRLESISESHAQLVRAAGKINQRLRGSKKFKSANELDDMLIEANSVIDRDVFYEECEQSISALCERNLKDRELRMMEREMIFMVLEKHGAIKQRRGDGIYGEKCEIFL